MSLPLCKQTVTYVPLLSLIKNNIISDPTLSHPDPTLTHPDPTLTHPDTGCLLYFITYGTAFTTSMTTPSSASWAHGHMDGA